MQVVATASLPSALAVTGSSLVIGAAGLLSLEQAAARRLPERVQRFV